MGQLQMAHCVSTRVTSVDKDLKLQVQQTDSITVGEQVGLLAGRMNEGGQEKKVRLV